MRGILTLALCAITYAFLACPIAVAQEPPVFSYPVSQPVLEALRRQGATPSQLVPDHYYVLPIYHADTTDIQSALAPLFPNIAFSVDTRARQLLFQGSKSQYAKVRSLVKKLDRSLPLVQLEVQIIELSYLESEEYRNLFSELGSGIVGNIDFKSGSLVPAAPLELAISAMAADGRAKVLAKPTLTVIDNHLSTIKVGDRLPYLQH